MAPDPCRVAEAVGFCLRARQAVTGGLLACCGTPPCFHLHILAAKQKRYQPLAGIFLFGKAGQFRSAGCGRKLGKRKGPERELAPGPCLVAEAVGFEPTVPSSGITRFRVEAVMTTSIRFPI